MLYAKNAKENEETIGIFVTFLSLIAFQLRRAWFSGPTATPMLAAL